MSYNMTNRISDGIILASLESLPTHTFTFLRR